MRLSPEDVTVIKECVTAEFGEAAKVFLFGSRTDDSRRGGDIDLLVELPQAIDTREEVTHTVKAIGKMYAKLGEQKIDLVVASKPEDETRLIIKNARKQGILL